MLMGKMPSRQRSQKRATETVTARWLARPGFTHTVTDLARTPKQLDQAGIPSEPASDIGVPHCETVSEAV